MRAKGGKFTEEDLESYLGIFDSLNDVYRQGLITTDMFYHAYAYDIEMAYDNPDVQTYLKEIEPDSFAGFERLAKEIKAASLPSKSPATH